MQEATDRELLFEALEKMRKDTLRNFAIACGAVFILFVFFFIRFPMIFLFSIIGYLLIIMFIWMAMKGPYVRFFKEKVVTGVLSSMLEDVSYEPNLGFSESEVMESRLVTRGNRYHSEDLVSGVYKGVFVQRSDVRIENETKSGDTTIQTTYFSGQWMKLKFQKEIEGLLYVIDHDFPCSGAKGIFNTNHLDKVKVESIAFNETFKVYCQQAYDAFYILTPRTMESLEKLASKNKSLSILFAKDTIHVAVNTNRNAFEIGLLRPVDIDEETKRVHDDMRVLLDFVDAIIAI